MLAAALLHPIGARAALMADPQKLYDTMKAAYAKAAAHGWSFFDQQYYLATIFDAGRAYSLQRPDDPGYAELAQLTVDIGSGLHYDPLIDHDAVEWWVREAALWVKGHTNDPAEAAKADALLARADSLEDAEALARYADEDAAANAQHFPGDTNALLQRVEANWRGWLITHDPSWRSLAFQRANQPNFPIANLPATWGPGFVNALKNAAAGAEGYTQGDQTNAKPALARLQAANPLMVIASVKAVPEDVYLTTLAPADEYFGPLGMSILGIRNEMKRVNFMIGYGYATQESSAAVQVANSIDALHKVYPRDKDLPQLLYDIYTTLTKIDTPAAKTARSRMRAVLTVEYQDSRQAQQLLAQ